MVDSGYESEENYSYVDGSEQLSLFVKPANHEQKKKRKYKTDIGRRENMAYDAEKDEYTLSLRHISRCRYRSTGAPETRMRTASTLSIPVRVLTMEKTRSRSSSAVWGISSRCV